MEHERPPVAPSPAPKRARESEVPPSTGKGTGGLWLEVGRLREEAEQHEKTREAAVKEATKAAKAESAALRAQLEARDELIDQLQSGLAASQAEAAKANAELSAARKAHASFAGDSRTPPALLLPVLTLLASRMERVPRRRDACGRLGSLGALEVRL